MGHFDELLVSKLAAGSTKRRIIKWSEALTLDSDTSGALVYTGDATAGILTLPAATQGYEVEIQISVTQTGDTHIKVPSGYFIGNLFLEEHGTATENTHSFASNGSSNDYINLDADTKGRLAGGVIRIVCDGTNWLVSGRLAGSGTLATPFADAES
jgi:hypothetical protein|tara:strand:+ start:54 stop:521 length:468 start_codon:yes stop_codon:yes gene_type:complete